MKRKLTFCIGILLLFMVVWGATLFALKYKQHLDLSRQSATYLLKR